MSTGVVSVRLDGELKARLDALSASTGRPAAYYVKEAVTEHLAELEHIYEIKAEAEAIRRGELKTRPLSELMSELGITQADLDALPDESLEKTE